MTYSQPQAFVCFETPHGGGAQTAVAVALTLGDAKAYWSHLKVDGWTSRPGPLGYYHYDHLPLDAYFMPSIKVVPLAEAVGATRQDT